MNKDTVFAELDSLTRKMYTGTASNVSRPTCKICQHTGTILVSGFIPDRKADTYKLLWFCEDHANAWTTVDLDKFTSRWHYVVVTADFADSNNLLNSLIGMLYAQNCGGAYGN